MSSVDPQHGSERAKPAAIPPGKWGFQQAAEALRAWTPTTADIEKIFPVVQRSLDSTQKLTEYQDGKAARVLTAMAFVSGMAAAINNLTVNQVANSSLAAVKWINPLYFAYYVAVVLGSLIVLYAIFPRFNIPKKNKRAEPFSLIFAPEIVRVKLDAWVGEFTSRSGDDLQLQAVRNEILETRLVAEKVALKISWLKRGMRCYFGALIVLVAALAVSFDLLVVERQVQISPSHTLLIFDADNTLWDTNAVYAEAQSALANSIAKAVGAPTPTDPIGYVRNIEEDLAATGRGFNLPAELVASSVAQRLSATPGGTRLTLHSNPADVAVAAAAYDRALKTPPSLFPDVERTLRRLKNQGYRMVLLSESEPALLEQRLRYHRINKYFEEVTTGTKSVLVFEEIANDYVSVVGGNVVSIGDRLDQEIQYANQAGFKSVWIPGGFRPKAANIAVTPTLSLNAFSELPDKLPGLLAK